MTPEELERERRASARALEEVLASARGPNVARNAEAVLGPTPAVAESRPGPLPELPPWNPPAPPDLGPVNESWTLGGPKAKAPEAQVRFASDQVQLDNALVSWVARHFEATHRHYDALIGQMQRRMDDIDERHRGLEKELVRHVHEMARRIDVVLGEGEKGRVSHESALRSLRDRLRELEEKLR